MENTKIDDIDEKKEESYQKLITLLKSLDCMTVTSSKTEMYQGLANKFSELGDYKDSKEYLLACKQLAKQTDDEVNIKIYEGAQDKKRKARNPKDYQLAAEEFRKAGGFGDSDKMALECDNLSAHIEQKNTRNTFLVMGGVLLGILALLFISIAPVAKYNIAKALVKTDSYSTALKLYTKLGDYKDSPKRVLECNYMIGLESAASEDFKNAKKAFAAAGDYKDSDMRKVDALKHILRNSEAGNTVKIGSCNWVVLDIQDSQVLLIKKVAIAKEAYNLSPEDTTWENSTLRQYLNRDFLEETFSKEEQDNILPANVTNSGNAAYGTEGGNDTTDYLFPLSIEEAQKYQPVFQNFKSNSWLRTPGYTGKCAAFLSPDGSIMDYGYLVTSDDFTAAPALWFNIN